LERYVLPAQFWTVRNEMKTQKYENG